MPSPDVEIRQGSVPRDASSSRDGPVRHVPAVYEEVVEEQDNEVDHSLDDFLMEDSETESSVSGDKSPGHAFDELTCSACSTISLHSIVLVKAIQGVKKKRLVEGRLEVLYNSPEVLRQHIPESLSFADSLLEKCLLLGIFSFRTSHTSYHSSNVPAYLRQGMTKCLMILCLSNFPDISGGRIDFWFCIWFLSFTSFGESSTKRRG
jgi:hypothetical protein